MHSSDGDWRRAFDLLAAVEPEPGPPVAALLSDEASAAARALELAVVTASLPQPLVERLVAHALGHSTVSLVLVDTASFNGSERRRVPELLRLQAAGVAVAVLRRGDDLAERLAARDQIEAAHG